jgi:hypothetical protein
MQEINRTNQVECIKVAQVATLRHTKERPRDYGRIKWFSRTLFAGADGKGYKAIGAQGFMTKADFEAGAFRKYGLEEKDVQSNTEAEMLKKQNEELQKRILELENATKEPATKATKKKAEILELENALKEGGKK